MANGRLGKVYPDAVTYTTAYTPPTNKHATVSIAITNVGDYTSSFRVAIVDVSGAFYINGDDGTNGDGYYFPLYVTSTEADDVSANGTISLEFDSYPNQTFYMPADDQNLANVSAPVEYSNFDTVAAPNISDFIEYNYALEPRGVMERSGVVVNQGQLIRVYVNNPVYTFNVMGFEGDN